MRTAPLVSVIIVTYNRRSDVERCLVSILESSYEKLEIVVVDNCSTDGTIEMLQNKFSGQVRLVANDHNAMAAQGRNIGVKNSSGELLLFVDSDNVVDPRMIEELVTGISNLPDAGIIGPKMYYLNAPQILWWAGADISHWSSKTTYHGKTECDEGQYDGVHVVGHVPNVFMCWRQDFEQLGGFEPAYEIMYEESDLAERMRRMGRCCYLIAKAVTYHDVPLYEDADQKLRFLGMQTAHRAFLVARNRILYMRRNSNLVQFIFFLVLFLPMFSVYYSYMLLRYGKWAVARSYWRGIVSGLVGPTTLPN